MTVTRRRPGPTSTSPDGVPSHGPPDDVPLRGFVGLSRPFGITLGGKDAEQVDAWLHLDDRGADLKHSDTIVVQEGNATLDGTYTVSAVGYTPAALIAALHLVRR
jgi:hypothetical protein